MKYMDQKTLNQIEKVINKSLTEQEKRLEQRFATKDDLRTFATKDDLKGFATRDDLKGLEKRLNNHFATKNDLKQLREDIANDTAELVNGIAETFDKARTEDRKILNSHELRISTLENKAAA